MELGRQENPQWSEICSLHMGNEIEKDVSHLISLGKLDDFRRFLRIIALRTSQQVNYAEISNAVMVDARTVKDWIFVLQSSGIVMILQPYESNLAKRIVKTPKLYFMDTGLCAFLCGWADAGMLEVSSMVGAFFETTGTKFYNSAGSLICDKINRHMWRDNI